MPDASHRECCSDAGVRGDGSAEAVAIRAAVRSLELRSDDQLRPAAAVTSDRLCAPETQMQEESMRKVIVFCLAVCALSLSAATATKKKSTMKAPNLMVTTPGAMKWGDAPPFLEKGAQAAVLQGDPSKAGYFALRLRLPDRYRIAPHWHPTEERLTVISGTFHLAMGDSFDTSAGSAMTQGS